jgi:hypothetical protein
MKNVFLWDVPPPHYVTSLNKAFFIVFIVTLRRTVVQMELMTTFCYEGPNGKSGLCACMTPYNDRKP